MKAGVGLEGKLPFQFSSGFSLKISIIPITSSQILSIFDLHIEHKYHYLNHLMTIMWSTIHNFSNISDTFYIYNSKKSVKRFILFFLSLVQGGLFLFLNFCCCCCCLFMFERQTESEHKQGRRGKREGDTESEVCSRLWAVITEPDTGLELMNREIMTWVVAGCSTNWATQVPHGGLFLCVFYNFWLLAHVSLAFLWKNSARLVLRKHTSRKKYFRFFLVLKEVTSPGTISVIFLVLGVFWTKHVENI